MNICVFSEWNQEEHWRVTACWKELSFTFFFFSKDSRVKTREGGTINAETHLSPGDDAVALKDGDANHANHPDRAKCSRLCGSTCSNFCYAQDPFTTATGEKKKKKVAWRRRSSRQLFDQTSVACRPHRRWYAHATPTVYIVVFEVLKFSIMKNKELQQKKKSKALGWNGLNSFSSTLQLFSVLLLFLHLDGSCCSCSGGLYLLRLGRLRPRQPIRKPPLLLLPDWSRLGEFFRPLTWKVLVVEKKNNNNNNHPSIFKTCCSSGHECCGHRVKPGWHPQ